MLMFVNISPSMYNVGESLCSLNFASRCRNVELGQAKKQSSTSEVAVANQLRKSATLDSAPASASKAVTSVSRRPTTTGTTSSISSLKK